MTRRPALLVGALAPALALTLALPQNTAPAVASPAAAPVGADAPGAALQRLRAAAEGPVRVQRDADGQVEHLASSDGDAVLPAPASADSPGEAADAQLDRFGEAFGLDGDSSRAVVRRTLPSATGGSVVRADQLVDGVPVFGGQVVLSLADDNGVVSVDADTTTATSVARSEVTAAGATRAARAAVAKIHHASARSMRATLVGRRLYDPAVVHVDDPLGTRPVWEVTVADGHEVRETVLVGAQRGEIALHFNNVDHLSRVVCDNDNDDSVSSDDDVPECEDPAREEGDPATGVTDVDEAYDNLGVVAQEYDELNGTDLTDLIGVDQGGTKSLMSTVRWCFSDADCPYVNAFWDGTQMVFGEGLAGADDVVGHELTHGYVERTSNLFALHQSGAINESVADTIGEIIDHRHDLSVSDSNWLVGEDLGIDELLRSLKNPPAYGQPDRMRSSLFAAVDYDDDNGAVHQNDGVGNKTAYLISQGGTFNGQTVTGIDAGDASLAKTGLLYLETIPRLTSGAQYADLGLVLASTCDELADDGTGGFDDGDCVQVRKAVLATELAQAPLNGAAAANPTTRCPYGFGTPLVEATDDDGTRQFTTSFDSLWERTPDEYGWVYSGDSSWFGEDPALDPDTNPNPNTIVSTSAYLGPFTLPTDGAARTLSFHHAYLLDYEDGIYYDGAQVFVQTRNANGTWTTNTPTWVANGPRQSIYVSNTVGFGGDSRGYGTSVVDLRPYAGKTVRVQFKLVGDATVSIFGWVVDKIELQACSYRLPGAPALTAAGTSGNRVTVRWNPPASAGSGITRYQVIGAGRVLATVPATARAAVVNTPTSARSVTFGVRAVNAFNEVGPTSAGRTILATATTTSARAKVKKKKRFAIVATVRQSGGAAAPGMPVTLQRRVGAGSWKSIASGVTGSTGLKAWAVKQSRTSSYRVVTTGAGVRFGSVSAARVVRKK